MSAMKLAQEMGKCKNTYAALGKKGHKIYWRWKGRIDRRKSDREISYELPNKHND